METEKKLSELNFYYYEKLSLYLFPIYVAYKETFSDGTIYDLYSFFSQKDAEEHFRNMEINEGVTFRIEKLEMDLGLLLKELNITANLNKKNLKQIITIEQLNSIDLMNGNCWREELQHFYDIDFLCYLYEYTNYENATFKHPLLGDITFKIIS
ncbi:hypothetical protein [Elizabethkingia anophelis]|uniref:hypothetical protein n=1 Tax=Elizabethkingia anophelis TaxID=1117645 RepID=UPI0034627D7A